MDYNYIAITTCLISFFLFLLIGWKTNRFIYFFISLIMIAFVGAGVAGLINQRYEKTFTEKYPPKTSFYTFKFLGKDVLVMNPKIEGEFLIFSEGTLKPQDGFREITREEAMSIMMTPKILDKVVVIKEP